MSACANCGRNLITTGAVYCTLTCKRQHVTTSNTLTALVATGAASTVPNATPRLAAIGTRLASVQPNSDGSEPW